MEENENNKDNQNIGDKEDKEDKYESVESEDTKEKTINELVNKLGKKTIQNIITPNGEIT